jgi:hypothetical protein
MNYGHSEVLFCCMQLRGRYGLILGAKSVEVIVNEA